MEFPIISWKVFLDALQQQQTHTLEHWLRRWWFTNEGVIMASSAGQEMVGRVNNNAAQHETVQA